MQEETRNVDEIDLWAQRVFGTRTPESRRIRVRNGLKGEHAKREFDKLFKPEKRS